MILSSPAKAWNLVAEDNRETFDHRKYFFLPLLALLSVACFLEPLIKADEVLSDDLLMGLRNLVLVSLSYVLSFLVTPLLMNRYNVSLAQDSDKGKAEKLWLYALTPVFLVRILTSLFQDFFFFTIFIVYIVYVIWEAANSLYQIEDKFRAKFTMVNTALVLVLPILVECLLKWIIPGLSK